MAEENTRPATPRGFSTRAVHAGESRQKPYGSLTTPIIQTSTYTFENSQAVIAHMQRKMAELPLQRGEYGRYTNPTRETVERKLAELDGCEEAMLVASGMAAITTVFLTLLSAGDHLIITEDCYRKTREFAIWRSCAGWASRSPSCRWRTWWRWKRPSRRARASFLRNCRRTRTCG
jgi:cystathionine beta-lyase/cystathionine gamma-synthase